jgi:hypothetical protein
MTMTGGGPSSRSHCAGRAIASPSGSVPVITTMAVSGSPRRGPARDRSDRRVVAGEVGTTRLCVLRPVPASAFRVTHSSQRPLSRSRLMSLLMRLIPVREMIAPDILIPARVSWGLATTAQAIVGALGVGAAGIVSRFSSRRCSLDVPTIAGTEARAFATAGSRSTAATDATSMRLTMTFTTLLVSEPTMAGAGDGGDGPNMGHHGAGSRL